MPRSTPRLGFQLYSIAGAKAEHFAGAGVHLDNGKILRAA